MPNPRYPIYIPSKSRAQIATTPRQLDRMGVPYRLVVEEHQADDYRRAWGAEKVLVLDPAYQRDYVTGDDLGDSLGKGSGPPRNFAWDHAVSEGHAWHWELDDNIMAFYRFHENHTYLLGDGSGFHAMEEFATRWRNVGIAGPEYKMFVPTRTFRHPFTTNRKIYSCLLIRNTVPLRWECRYNEDVDLGLRMLKSGWMTIVFLAFAQDKLQTQQMDGGDTEAYISEGTLLKSQILVRRHPDVARVKWRFRRWHHFVDYRPWANMQLVPDPDFVPSPERYTLRQVPQTEKIYAGIVKTKRDYSQGKRSAAPPTDGGEAVVDTTGEDRLIPQVPSQAPPTAPREDSNA